MAKGKNRNRSSWRDPIASLVPVALPSAVRSPSRDLLRQIEDRRSFYPEPATRPALTFSGSSASIDAHIPKKKANRNRVPTQFAFSAPGDVLVCVRRKRRKEVLHALRKTGKRGQRRPRRNRFSDIRC